MSDRQQTGVVVSLEELFESRDFGRRSTPWVIPARATTEPTNHPPHLEEVFLSELFGRPEALHARAAPRRAAAPSPGARPTLVLLTGHGDAGRDVTRYRGAIGAVSGVAAAALVVAGMSSGAGRPSERPTISAAGAHPAHGSPPAGANSPRGREHGDRTTQPNASGTTSGQPPAAPSAGAGEALVARPASATTPAAAAEVVVAPPPASVEVEPSPPAPGGGTTPSGPSPGGGGSVLTPALVLVGSTVSSLGTTVTAASSDLAQTLPAASPVTGLLGTAGTTVTNLGHSVAGS